MEETGSKREDAKRKRTTGTSSPRRKQAKLNGSSHQLENINNNMLSRASNIIRRKKRSNTPRARLDNSNKKEEELSLSYDVDGLQLKKLRVVIEDRKISEKDEGTTGELAVEENEENGEWEVEKILKKKVQSNGIFYLIKWKNWSSKYNTWEPERNLLNCRRILEDFENDKDKLLAKFKKEIEFHPNIQDIEKYLAEIKYNGESIDCKPVEQDKICADICSYFKRKHARSQKLELVIKRDILRTLLCNARKQQLECLREWEREMNAIAKGKPTIHIENVVDLESAPDDFFYIDDYLPGIGVIIPDDPPIGCECINCDAKTNCCFAQNDCSAPYTPSGKVRVPLGTPIFECNKRCKCDENCTNRVVQRGTAVHLCIFRTSNGRGWGVKTLQPIKKGTFVIEYVGEVITNEEAEKRGKEYDAAGRTYLFDLDYNETEDQCPYTVDAAVYGNVSHFINHSCDPNLAVYGVWVNCLDPNLPKLALFATRDIKQNEEISFDYMCQSLKNTDISLRQDMKSGNYSRLNNSMDLMENLQLRPDALESETRDNKTLCKCGADNCRRYLF